MHSNRVTRTLHRLRHVGLVARFSIVGLTLGVVIAAGLACIIEARTTELLLTNVAARAADQVFDLAPAGYLNPDDFAPPHMPQSLDSIAVRLDPIIARMRADGSSIIRLQIFAADGTIVYSDLPSKRGDVLDMDDEEHLVEALQGNTVQEISDLDEPENRELHDQFQQALEVYVPIQFGGNIVGAYEIYQDLAPVHAVRPVVWGAMVSGFLLLFAALLVVVRAAALLIRKQQQTLVHQAFHDALTDLPNRTRFLELVERALANGPVALMFVDLDGVKLINDSLGHAAGDWLLVTIAARLAGCCVGGDTAARLGGDEFALVLHGVDDPSTAVAYAEHVLSVLRAPVVLGAGEVFPTASIGIALGSRDTDNPDALLRQADIAMYTAKARGKNGLAVFDQTMANDAAERLAMESDLHRALERGEFRVHYQPILDLSDGHISEMEALARWHHPTHGTVSPATFIPVAEQTGLIVPVGQWVLEEACRQAAAWRLAFGAAAPVMSVNLSARQFQQPGLVSEVERALRTAGLDAQSLKLEITESVAMQDAEATVEILQALTALGIHLAIDDFGTGYSSLAYLKRLPVDTLKIDRSFIDGLGRDAQDTAIVQSIIALAQALGLSVTGEGIEAESQYQRLQSLGCERGQGFLFSRPAPAEDIEVMLGNQDSIAPRRAA